MHRCLASRNAARIYAINMAVTTTAPVRSHAGDAEDTLPAHRFDAIARDVAVTATEIERARSRLAHSPALRCRDGDAQSAGSRRLRQREVSGFIPSAPHILPRSCLGTAFGLAVRTALLPLVLCRHVGAIPPCSRSAMNSERPQRRACPPASRHGAERRPVMGTRSSSVMTGQRCRLRDGGDAAALGCRWDDGDMSVCPCGRPSARRPGARLRRAPGQAANASSYGCEGSNSARICCSFAISFAARSAGNFLPVWASA